VADPRSIIFHFSGTSFHLALCSNGVAVDQLLWLVWCDHDCGAAPRPLFVSLPQHLGLPLHRCLDLQLAAHCPVVPLSPLSRHVPNLFHCFFLSKWFTFSPSFPPGQKKNVLRNRIDSCDYDVEQLLLGTILFTFLSLLVPTVMVYYVLFSGVRHSFCHPL